MTKVIVTGCASGIGQHIAQFLTEHHYDVIGIDINTNTIPSLYQFHKVDCACSEAVKKLFKTFDHIDIAINCAGIACVRKDITELTDNDLLAAFQVNFISAFNCVKEEIKLMRQQKKGKIINLASIVGLIGSKHALAYASTKAGMIVLTKIAAAENSEYDIQINSISPAGIDTPLVRGKNKGAPAKDYRRIYPVGHIGHTSDVVSVVEMLIKNNFMTGNDIKVDGGLTEVFEL